MVSGFTHGFLAMSSTLTPVAAAVLRAFVSEAARLGSPPTFRAVASACGNAVENSLIVQQLVKLRRDGSLPRPIGRGSGYQRLIVTHFGSVPCGAPAAMLEDEYKGDWMDLALPLPDNVYALTARGKCMVGAGINPGDKLLFRPHDGDLPNGKTVVCVISGSVTCKVLKLIDDEWWLLPKGESADPIPLGPERDDVFILGVLVAVWRLIDA